VNGGRRAGAAGAALVVAALAIASSASPTPPGRNGLIAFVTHTYSSEEGAGIAVIRPDGTGFRRLTKDHRDGSPAWSPKGRWLAFERDGIYVVKADGRGLKRLTRKGLDAHDPTWSPDGRRIAFISNESLFVVGSSGLNVRRLLPLGDSFLSSPSWSPDGASIAFAAVTEDDIGGGDAYGSIVVVPAAGGEVTYLTSGDDVIPDDALPGTWAEDADPDWSPDGSRIAFTRMVWLCGKCDQEEIFSVAADGSDVRWISANPEGRFSGGAGPSWSPDGTMLVGERGGIVILTLDGKTMRVLNLGGSDPAWQPR
jgi:Tol biopolymer transport system component